MAVIRSPEYDFDEWTRGAVISAFAFFVIIATIAVCACGDGKKEKKEKDAENKKEKESQGSKKSPGSKKEKLVKIDMTPEPMQAPAEAASMEVPKSSKDAKSVKPPLKSEKAKSEKKPEMPKSEKAPPPSVPPKECIPCFPKFGAKKQPKIVKRFVSAKSTKAPPTPTAAAVAKSVVPVVSAKSVVPVVPAKSVVPTQTAIPQEPSSMDDTIVDMKDKHDFKPTLYLPLKAQSKSAESTETEGATKSKSPSVKSPSLKSGPSDKPPEEGGNDIKASVFVSTKPDDQVSKRNPLAGNARKAESTYT